MIVLLSLQTAAGAAFGLAEGIAIWYLRYEVKVVVRVMLVTEKGKIPDQMTRETKLVLE